MNYAPVTATGDGATTVFTVNFPYLNEGHVYAYVDDVLTSYAWVTSGSIEISPAPASGAAIEIKRVTPGTSLVSFSAGPTLSSNLTIAARQGLYRAEEIYYESLTYNSAELAASVAAAAASAAAASSSADTAYANALVTNGDVVATGNNVTAAQDAQAAAEAALASTLAAYDNFDDRYLGPKASEPTLDNDGNALVAGALYFNTTSEAMFVYSGTAWVAAYVSGTEYLLKTGDTMTGSIGMSDTSTMSWTDVGLARSGAGILKITDGSTGIGTAQLRGIQGYLSGIKWGEMFSTYFKMSSAMHLQWNSSTNTDAGALDVGLARNAAGILSVTNGSTGFGQLIVAQLKQEGNRYWYLGGNAIGLASDAPLSWANGGNASWTKDVGLARDSAGVLEVTDGSTGTGKLIVATPTADTHAANKAYVDAAQSQAVGINTQTGTTYTLALTDAGQIVEMNNASANTLTVPPNSSVAFPVNSRIDIIQYGAGATTIAAGSGVTLRSKDGNLIIDGQYAGATLYKRGTDEWVVIGALTA